MSRQLRGKRVVIGGILICTARNKIEKNVAGICPESTNFSHVRIGRLGGP